MFITFVRAFVFCLFIQKVKILVGVKSCSSTEICMSHNSITGLILARGGSKGILAKNLADVGNITLLTKTIRIAQKFGKFSSIWVSTDDLNIAAEAKNNGALVHWRSASSATDTAPSILGVQDFCSSHPETTIVALLQCTSPFLQVSYLNEAYSIMTRSKNLDCVFSVTREFKLRWRKMKDGTVVPVNFDPGNRPRRQDWSGELVENGMFYFTTVKLISQGLLQGNRCGVVEIPKHHSIEIDTAYDLHIARALIRITPVSLN